MPSLASGFIDVPCLVAGCLSPSRNQLTSSHRFSLTTEKLEHTSSGVLTDCDLSASIAPNLQLTRPSRVHTKRNWAARLSSALSTETARVPCAHRARLLKSSLQHRGGRSRNTISPLSRHTRDHTNHSRKYHDVEPYPPGDYRLPVSSLRLHRGKQQWAASPRYHSAKRTGSDGSPRRRWSYYLSQQSPSANAISHLA